MAIAAESMSKSFSGLRVLDDVKIAVADGRVHALLGANGSGKSTLVKILTGVYQPDHAAIRLKDRVLPAIVSPQQAQELGIAVVHQEAPLIDNSTVAECIALFRGYPSKGGRVLWGELYEQVAAMFERFNVKIDPRMLAGRLSPAERALISLMIALDRTPSALSLLILDEVTASLPRDEAEPYLERVSTLAKSGVGVLMVTHRLAEVRSHASDVTVLRDGRVVFAGAPGEVDDDAIVGLMIGEETRSEKAVGGARANVLGGFWREFADGAKSSTAAAAEGDVLLKVENLSGRQLRDISFEVRAGEIVGIAGLEETGISELPQILAGAAPFAAGRISVKGKLLPRSGSPAAAISAGLTVLPADRLHSGGVRTLSVAENLMLPAFGRYWTQPNREKAVIERLMSDFDVRPRRSQALFSTFSGGNQQKSLLAKWLHLRPAVLVLDDPTSGVDPGARQTIFQLLRDAVNEGVGILFFSTEPEQLAAMCSRVLVLKDGAVATTLTGEALNYQSISRWCYA
jgi:ribose transport system ATP-binding protein